MLNDIREEIKKLNNIKQDDVERFARRLRSTASMVTPNVLTLGEREVELWSDVVAALNQYEENKKSSADANKLFDAYKTFLVALLENVDRKGPFSLWGPRAPDERENM